MIILTSNGLSSPRLLEAVGRLAAPGGRAAIVTTASVRYKEKDKHIPRIAAELGQMGLAAECVDIETQSPELLRGFDVVEINGGNPFYLLKQIRRQGAGDALRHVAQSKILIGISAGSIALQQSVELIAGYSPEMNDGIGWQGCSGLGLTGLEILPHYSRFCTRFEGFEERCREYEQATGRNVIRLEDGQGVFADEQGGHWVV